MVPELPEFLSRDSRDDSEQFGHPNGLNFKRHSFWEFVHRPFIIEGKIVVGRDLE